MTGILIKDFRETVDEETFGFVIVEEGKYINNISDDDDVEIIKFKGFENYWLFYFDNYDGKDNFYSYGKHKTVAKAEIDGITNECRQESGGDRVK